MMAVPLWPTHFWIYAYTFADMYMYIYIYTRVNLCISMHRV